MFSLWLTELKSSILVFFQLRIVINGTFYQSHPWFKDVVWEKLYEMEAAFKPEVNGELDTQNFMKFDEVKGHGCAVVFDCTLDYFYVLYLHVALIIFFNP